MSCSAGSLDISPSQGDWRSSVGSLASSLRLKCGPVPSTVYLLYSSCSPAFGLLKLLIRTKQTPCLLSNAYAKSNSPAEGQLSSFTAPNSLIFFWGRESAVEINVSYLPAPFPYCGYIVVSSSVVTTTTLPPPHHPTTSTARVHVNNGGS